MIQKVMTKLILSELQDKINSWELNEDLNQRPVFYNDHVGGFEIKVGYYDYYSITFPGYNDDISLSRYGKYSVTVEKSQRKRIIDFLFMNIDAETRENDSFIQELDYLYNHNEAVIA